MQEKFNWRSVAVSAIAAPLSQALSQGAFDSAPTDAELGQWAEHGIGQAPRIASDFSRDLGSFGTNLGRGLVSGVVTQTVRREVYGGGKVDYASIAADSFGNTLGSSIAEEMRASETERRLRQEQFEMEVAEAQERDDMGLGAAMRRNEADERSRNRGLSLNRPTGFGLGYGELRERAWDASEQVGKPIPREARAAVETEAMENGTLRPDDGYGEKQGALDDWEFLQAGAEAPPSKSRRLSDEASKRQFPSMTSWDREATVREAARQAATWKGIGYSILSPATGAVGGFWGAVGEVTNRPLDPGRTAPLFELGAGLEGMAGASTFGLRARPAIPSWSPRLEGLSPEIAARVSGARWDYTANLAAELKHSFHPGYTKFSGLLDGDLVLVQFHRSDRALGQGRSAAWWTTPDQANVFITIDDVRQGLVLPPVWGPRDAISVARIPKGTAVEFYKGTASEKTDTNVNVRFVGNGVQYRFKNFDPAWIVETRKIPGRE